MRATLIALLLVALVLAVRPVGAADTSGLAQLAAKKLMERKSSGVQPRPETHTTDFQGDSLGCITLTRFELRSFGYPGHAFFCESADTGEILGAVLTRFGFVRCLISGDFVGNGCYAFTICDVPDSACVR
jgi:hypothetical protein